MDEKEFKDMVSEWNDAFDIAKHVQHEHSVESENFLPLVIMSMFAIQVSEVCSTLNEIREQLKGGKSDEILVKMESVRARLLALELRIK